MRILVNKPKSFRELRQQMPLWRRIRNRYRAWRLIRSLPKGERGRIAQMAIHEQVIASDLQKNGEYGG